VREWTKQVLPLLLKSNQKILPLASYGTAAETDMGLAEGPLPSGVGNGHPLELNSEEGERPRPGVNPGRQNL
jgi:hypothetical protein